MERDDRTGDQSPHSHLRAVEVDKDRGAVAPYERVARVSNSGAINDLQEGAVVGAVLVDRFIEARVHRAMQRHPDQLVGGPTEQAFTGDVEVAHASSEVDLAHPMRERSNDRLEARALRLVSRATRVVH